MEDESKIIKKVDMELREFIGGSENHIDEVFSDSEMYRRVAERFWKKTVVAKAA